MPQRQQRVEHFFLRAAAAFSRRPRKTHRRRGAFNVNGNRAAEEEESVMKGASDTRQLSATQAPKKKHPGGGSAATKVQVGNIWSGRPTRCRTSDPNKIQEHVSRTTTEPWPQRNGHGRHQCRRAVTRARHGTTIQRQKLARQHAQVCMPVGSLEKRKQFQLMPVVSWCRAHVENEAVRMSRFARNVTSQERDERNKWRKGTNQATNRHFLGERERERNKAAESFGAGLARGAQSDRSISSSPCMAWHSIASRKHEESDAVVLIRYRYSLLGIGGRCPVLLPVEVLLHARERQPPVDASLRLRTFGCLDIKTIWYNADVWYHT